MLDSLPWEEFNETTKFFDPACKGGEFLALIHDRMMKRLYELGYKSDLAEPVKQIKEYLKKPISMIPYVAHCADRRRRSGAQTSATEVERSRTGRRSVRAQWRTPPEGEVWV